jgi:hypothetical protein
VTLIEGGYGNRAGSEKRRARAHRTCAPHTVGAPPPLLIPLALALTLGVILAVSSVATPTAHVNQQSTTQSARP